MIVTLLGARVSDAIVATLRSRTLKHGHEKILPLERNRETAQAKPLDFMQHPTPFGSVRRINDNKLILCGLFNIAHCYVGIKLKIHRPSLGLTPSRQKTTLSVQNCLPCSPCAGPFH
jgi:hypothetical protein